MFIKRIFGLKIQYFVTFNMTLYQFNALDEMQQAEAV